MNSFLENQRYDRYRVDIKSVAQVIYRSLLSTKDTGFYCVRSVKFENLPSQRRSSVAKGGAFRPQTQSYDVLKSRRVQNV